MKSMTFTTLIIGVVILAADVICSGDFKSFVEGFATCGLVMKICDEWGVP